MNKRADWITFLKGFSILFIVLMHIFSWKLTLVPQLIWMPLRKTGGLGIFIFFFCSGFGLYYSRLVHKLPYIDFIKKRVLSIYLPYALAILIYFFIPFTYERNDRIVALLSHLFLFKMFVPVYEESFATPFWYISTLFQFYLLFYFICKCKEKIGNWKSFIVICAGGGFLWRLILLICVGTKQIRILYECFIPFLWIFALGMMVAELFYKNELPELKTWKLLLITIVSFLIDLLMVASGLEIFGTFNEWFGAIGYLSFALFLWKSNILIIRKIGYEIATFSYEWYLMHSIIIYGVFQLEEIIYRKYELKGYFPLLLQLVLGVIAFILSAVVAKLYHYFLKIMIGSICSKKCKSYGGLRK